jgi:antirestriction protein
MITTQDPTDSACQEHRWKDQTIEPDIGIYIADLAAYNAGKPHGIWLDAMQPPADLYCAIETMLTHSSELQAKDWLIYGYIGFEGYTVGESADLEEIHAVACLIDEYGALAAKLLEEGGANNAEEAKRMLKDGYYGCFDTVASYVQQFIEDTTDIPDNIRFYIDYTKLARDMVWGGDILTIETASDEVHVFYGG